MIPGMPSLDPKNLQRMMKQFGMKTEELNVRKVIFELENKKLVFEDAEVTVMEVQGKKTYTIVGTPREESKELEIPEEDIEMVSSSANVSEEEARNELRKTKGDIAEAISNLKK
ncbi:MAG TPA: nascent polypeptide-associated complex protein [archaeon]|nr:nascent polypeptide-associated complex protein [archaeon]